MCDRGELEPHGWVKYGAHALWCGDVDSVSIEGDTVLCIRLGYPEPEVRKASSDEDARALADRIKAARTAYDLERERLAGAHAQPEVDADPMVDLVTLRVRRRAVIAAQESRQAGITALMYGSLKTGSVIASHVPLPYAEVLRRLGLPARSETQEPAESAE